MKNIMLSVTAVMCLVGSSSLSFAEDMGKMKDEMKGDMKGHKDEMMMKGDMKAKPDEMKGEMMEKKGEMKSEMKGAMGK